MKKNIVPIIVISAVSLFVVLGITFAMLSKNQNTTNNVLEQTRDNTITNDNTEEKRNENNNKPVKVVDKACSVFSPQDIFSAFGITVNNGQELKTMETENGLPLASCDWSQSEEEQSSFAKAYSIHLTVYNHPDNAIAQQDFNNARITIGGMDYKEINGLADGAIFLRGTAAGPDKTQVMIKWIKDNIVYTLSAVRLDKVTQADEEKLKALVDLKF